MDNIASKMTVDIEVTGVRTYAWRIEIGLALMKLGAWVLGMQTKINLHAS